LAKNKSQHFVPRVYLRNFSDSSENASINTWLPKSDKIIRDAPLRSQCAKPYFYGKDLVLENLLQVPEGWYGEVLNKIQIANRATLSDLETIRFFWLLQLQRGIVAVTQTHKILVEMRDRGFSRTSETLEFLGEDLSLEDLAKMSLSNTRQSIHHLDDLKMCLLVNESDSDIITSDNPAVSSNRFLMQRQGKFLRSWGLSSSGFYAYLPLSPRFGFLAYDSGVYDLSGRNENICALDDRDVHALNYLVMIHSQSCIFFKDWGKKEHLLASLSQLSEEIPETRFRLNLAVKDELGSSSGGERFAIATDQEFCESEHGLFHMESLPPRPTFHLPRLKYKSRKVFFDSKTGAGILRPKSIGLRELLMSRLWR
jgi:hypothetical protein